jgi:Cytochrome bd-type quinol oxidase, subunit 1
MGAVAHVLAVDPVPARSQMGSSLGFHIILACFGIAFAAVTMTVEWIGIRRGDAAALLLARRWSKVMAVLVAVGAVSGTVLSYEMGLLWPGLMGRSERRSASRSRWKESSSSWKRSSWGVPVRVAAAVALGALVERDADRGGRGAGRHVGGGGELVDELTGRVHAPPRQDHQRRPGVGVFQRLDPV